MSGLKVEVLHSKSLKSIASMELDGNSSIGDVKKSVALESNEFSFKIKKFIVNL